MNEQQDLEAVRRCLAGDVGAFEDLIVRYERAVMNLAYRILRDREDARDVAQSVFIKAYAGLVAFNPRYKFFSWLYRIAVNEALNFAGKRSRRPGPDADWAAAAPDPQQELAASELRGRIDRALALLDPRQRALLALSADGLTYREIGSTLELSETKVKSKLFAARNKLRELLAGNDRPAHAR
jgi:RNA polymerase sigma-70 factor, ECF subfamily